MQECGDLGEADVQASRGEGMQRDSGLGGRRDANPHLMVPLPITSPLCQPSP